MKHLENDVKGATASRTNVQAQALNDTFYASVAAEKLALGLTAAAPATTASEFVHEIASWNAAQIKLYRNLAILVQYFQMELAQTDGTSIQALVNPLVLMQYSAASADPDSVPNKALDSVLMPITYYDGCPTVEGVPVWERLSGEALPYYEAFKVYRDMKKIAPSRSMAQVAEQLNIPLKNLVNLAKVWHWQIRVVPYDIQCAIDRQILREQQARRVDQMMSKGAQQMFEVAVDYLNTHTEQMNPKTAIDLLKAAAPLMRVAAGLPANAPLEELRTSGGSGNVNVSISTGGSADKGVHGMSASEVAEKTKQQAEDPTHLAAILNVLIQSGALESTVLKDDTVDVDFVESAEDENQTDTGNNIN